MPPQTQRRRRNAAQDSDDEPPRRQSRRQPDSDDGEGSEEENEDRDVHMDGAADGAHEQLVQKLVRYALACEYARMPIRRDGIREKVLAGNKPASFKRLFDDAQTQLRHVFGMEMSELPAREKRTLKEKQKATARKAATQGGGGGGGSAASASSRQYILTSTLPTAYRQPPLSAPSRIPSAAEEAAYVAVYTTLISLVALSGGELSDMKLRRHLGRFNAAQNLPMDRTDGVLARLVRQGYLDKVVERSADGDDDSVSWCVGPRGKVEVPPQSIAAFATEVWGELPDDFNKKLYKSLGLQVPQAEAQAAVDEG